MTAVDWFFALCVALMSSGLWGMLRLVRQRPRELVDLTLSRRPMASNRHSVEERRNAWLSEGLSDDEGSRRFDGVRRGWAA